MRILYFLSLVLSFGSGFLQAQQDPFVAERPKQSGSANLPCFQEFIKEVRPAAVSNITPFELQSWKKQDKVFHIFDLRDAEDFNLSHIPKAKRLGYTDFTVEKVWMIHRDEPIIIYCHKGDRSPQMAEYLKLMGFKDVRILEGFLPAWIESKAPLVDNQGQEAWLWQEDGKNGKKVLHKYPAHTHK